MIIAVLIIFGQGITTTSYFSPGSGRASEKKDHKLIGVSVKTLSVEAIIARTPSERKRGLSRRESLPITSGMLFIFENKGNFGFWMKDMKFPIDIIWIDEEKRIVDIAANVRVEPDKKDRELAVYKSQAEALYVLEVNAGLSALHGLSIGDQVNFEL